MSYSFSVKAANKADAKAAVSAKFDEVISQQPIHARDRGTVLANAGAVIDLLQDDDAQDIAVSCNGYVSWQYSGEQHSPETQPLSTASVACSANLVKREA